MPPYQGGGDMISSVTFEKTTYNDSAVQVRSRHARTSRAASAWARRSITCNEIGMDKIAAHEHELLVYGTEALAAIPGLRLIGTAQEKAAVLSFVIEGIHPHDIGTVLDQAGIAVRTGHHCAQPVMDRFDVPATTRASFAFYNTRRRSIALVDGIGKVKEIFAMLNDLYQEIILDHSKKPRNCRPMDVREPAWRRATIRCAATSSSCFSITRTASSRTSAFRARAARSRRLRRR